MKIISEIYNDVNGKFIFLDKSELSELEKTEYEFVAAVEWYDKSKYDINIGKPEEEVVLTSSIDGWYTAYSMFVPNMKWYDRNKELKDAGQPSEFDGLGIIYVIDYGKLYRVEGKDFVLVDYSDLLNDDIFTSAKKDIQDILKVYTLRARYIELSRRIIYEMCKMNGSPRSVTSSNMNYIKELLGGSLYSLQYIWDEKMFHEGQRMVENLLNISEAYETVINRFYESRCIKAKGN